MEIEFNLDVILKERGLRISEAARLCNIVYPNMYGFVMNKRKRVDLQTIAKLSSGLELPIGKLFREKPPLAVTSGGGSE